LLRFDPQHQHGLSAMSTPNPTATPSPAPAPASPNAAAPAGGPPNNGKRRRIMTFVAVGFAAFGLLWFIFWYFVLSERERTDDAYVTGNQLTVSAQVAGTVVGVAVDNTDLVTAGQVLVRLDPTDAET